MAKAQSGDREQAKRTGRGSPEDQRRSRRERLVVRVDYSTVDSFFSEFTTNINEGGLFIETDSPSAVGTLVQLQFQLPGTAEPLKIVGRVIWTTAEVPNEIPGMGIEFEELDPLARDRVNDVVRRLRSGRFDDDVTR